MALSNFTVLTLFLGISTPSATPEAEPDAEEILARAVDVQRRHQQEKPEVRFDYKLRAVTEKLDGDGEIDETDERLFRSYPIEGEPYERLVQKDGRDLTKKELAEEARREKEFRERLADEASKNRDDNWVTFDEELVSRYDVRVESVQPLEGHSCYVVAFSPKNRDLPTERRIDYIVNRAMGRIWIDSETFEVARVEFELKEKLKLLWGLVGSISAMTGKLERRPLEENVWLMERFDLYIKGRTLFSSYQLRQRFIWDDYAPLDRVAGSSSSPRSAKR